MLAGLKILSWNCAFDFDRVLYYIQGWNLNPVKRAEFNPGVENASFNRPLKTLIHEEITVCRADPNMAWVTAYESSCMFKWTEAAQILELGLKNTCGSSFPTDPIFFCQRYYFFDAAKRAALFSVCGCGLLIQYSVPKWHLLWVTVIIELCTHNMNNMTRKRLFASVPHDETVTENVNTRKVHSYG
jgi:hypothetical protein